MDPINILVGVVILVSLGANLGSVKVGVKSSLSNTVVKPKSYLQKVPPNFSAFILVLQILGMFGIGLYEQQIENQYFAIRIVGLICFGLFSWMQIAASKSLGKNYSQEVLILKGHELKTGGIYKFIRHPQYMTQILADIGAGVALLNYIVLPLVVLVEMPLLILRAGLEDKILSKHFKDEFVSYKKKSGFMVPFIG
ncbi:MAG: isoprenylcysteine carboxylmethyltransferase family protein [bacterium]